MINISVMNANYLYFFAIVVLVGLASCLYKGRTKKDPVSDRDSLDRVYAYIPENEVSAQDGYKAREKPNERGYFKVSRGAGETYSEGIMNSGKKQLLPETSLFLVQSIVGKWAIVQKGRGFIVLDLERLGRPDYGEPTWKAYETAENYTQGLAAVSLNDRYFYLDENAKPVFGRDFDFAEPFFQGTALVIEKGHKFIIDLKGVVVCELHYENVGPYSNYLWKATQLRNGIYKSGLVDRRGKLIGKLEYSELYGAEPPINRGWAKVGNKYGFLNEHGVAVIPLIYDYAEIFDTRGHARVELKGRSFEIDVNGTEIRE